MGLAKGLTSPAAVWELVTYNLAQGVGITNNANATKIPPDAADKLMLSVNDALKPPGSQGQVGIDCDSGSVCDGMGAFGSCFRGRNSPNYSCQTKNIEIDNDGFTFTVDLKCNSAGNQVKCNYHIGYDGTPQGGGQAGGALGSGQGGYFSSHDLFYVADIGLSAVNRLSANNTMGEALKIIQQQIAAINLGSTATFEELFKKVHSTDAGGFTRDFGYMLMATLGDKYMGDFVQGLHVLANNGGVLVGAPLWKYRSEAEGDRPSFVKNSVLALCSRSGIDLDSSLFYTWSGQGQVDGLFVYADAARKKALESTWASVGGGKRRTRRKRPRARKTRRKGQNTKNKKTRIRKRRGKKPTRERNARRRAKTNKRFVFRK